MRYLIYLISMNKWTFVYILHKYCVSFFKAKYSIENKKVGYNISSTSGDDRKCQTDYEKLFCTSTC